MWELLRSPVFLVFACITVVSVVPTVAYYWHKVRKAELEASLKHEMIERGMSAADIKQVLEASQGRKATTSGLAPDPASTRSGEEHGNSGSQEC